MDIINISAYKFLPLTDLPDLKAALLEKAIELGLRGTVLLSPEGVNCFFAGTEEAVKGYQHFISVTLGLGELPYKESCSQYQPFKRMLVKIKKEIISMGIPHIKPHEAPAPRLSAQQLKQWYDEGRDFILLDTRNDYEVRLGTFKNAMDLNIATFRDFPEAVANLDPAFKEKTFVTVCTGGIRCEKAAPLMLSLGFQHVYQLEGGMLRYFEECGGAHWEKECFVFDERVALNPNLQETTTVQCFACRSPLTPEEQKDVRYQIGLSCPYCIVMPA
jgi:predicted sulfurtransferase